MRDDHRNAPVGGNPPADDADQSYADSLLHADDLLLDALGRGEPAPADDPFAALLATWRAELDHDQSDPDADLVRAFCGTSTGPVPPAAAATVADPVTADPAAPPTGPATTSTADPTAAPQPALDATPPSGPTPTPLTGPAAAPRPSAPDRHGPAGRGPASRNRHRRGSARRVGRLGRLLIGVATALVAVAALGVGANNAGPTSPLWPVARLVYPEQAAGRAAEHEIDLARQAVTDQRYDRAREHLDRAEAHLAEMTDPGWARQLGAEIARLRAALPPAPGQGPGATPPAGTAPDAPGVPVQPTPAPTPGRSTAPGGGGQPAAPTPSPTRPGLLPPLLPSPLLPDLPLVPSLLPSGLPLI